MGGIIHITLTGPLAGTPACGLSRAEMLERGESGIHMPYSAKGEAAILARGDVCPDCKRAWVEALEDDE